MDIRIVLAGRLERYHIHVAVCRDRRQGLVCSTCAELAASARRAAHQLDLVEAV